jgi:hypothetical protein
MELFAGSGQWPWFAPNSVYAESILQIHLDETILHFGRVVLPCAVLSAQDKPAPAGTAAGKLDAFAPLIGRDWISPLPKGNLTDTQRFEWMYSKKFIRNTHAVKTAKGEIVYEGETVYAWDARASRIVLWYWNASGGFLEGTVSIGGDGTINTEGQNHGGANQLDRTRVYNTHHC